MAKKSKKKKKQARRHHFINTAAQVSSGIKPEVASPKEEVEKKPSGSTPATAEKIKKTKANNVASIDPEVQAEVKVLKRESIQTAVIGGGIIAFLIILWLVFEHTGVGNTIYNLIKV